MIKRALQVLLGAALYVYLIQGVTIALSGNGIIDETIRIDEIPRGLIKWYESLEMIGIVIGALITLFILFGSILYILDVD